MRRSRRSAPSFRFDASGECSTCGFRGGALEHLLVARRLPLEAAREELARGGASQAWIEKACRRHARNVEILAAFADALQRNPARRHVMRLAASR